MFFNCSIFYYQMEICSICSLHIFFYLSWKRKFPIYFLDFYFSTFWKRKCHFFHQSLYTGEKANKTNLMAFFFIQLLFSLYKIISKIPPQKKNNFN